MSISLIIITALVLDLIFGEPHRWHPLVGFGKTATWLESVFNKTNRKNHFVSYLFGVFAWALMVLPVVAVIWFIEQFQMNDEMTQPYVEVIVGVICLTFAIGTKSLMQHAKAVSDALKNSDITLAQKRAAMIVSRDTAESDELAVNRATIESVLENGSDAIFAAIFWFIILGAPGVILYRLANTLDAMWGYRTERFNYFGWAAARIDDGLNWVPARLTALSYALAGNLVKALKCWHQQAKHWHGINPGVVMATGAGALNISLGGVATYHGEQVERPVLGTDSKPQVADIDRAVKLIYKSLFIWIVFIVLGDYFVV